MLDAVCVGSAVTQQRVYLNTGRLQVKPYAMPWMERPSALAWLHEARCYSLLALG